MEDVNRYLPRITENRITAYQLAQAVVDAVREEPKRLRMEDWVRRVAPERDGNPKCGTVACVAGWVSVLSDASHQEFTGSESDRAIYLLVGRPKASMDNPLPPIVNDLHACFYNFPSDRGIMRSDERYLEDAIFPFINWMAKYRPQLERRILVRETANDAFMPERC